MTIKNISYVRGDSYALKMTIKGLQDLEITKMYLTVKDNYLDEEPIFQLSLRNGIEPITESQSNEDTDIKYNILFNPENTEQMMVSYPYYYDIKIIVGNLKKTIVKGSFTLEPNYTRASNEV